MYFDQDNVYFDDMYDIDTTKYNNFDIDIGSINFNRNSNLHSYEEGFNKDDLLYKLQMYNFALKDLNLYLDVHPNDESMIKEFQNVRRKYNEVKEKYESAYGPLVACDDEGIDTFRWTQNPWPWDKGGK